MAIEIKVPDIGADEVEITEILVKVGDKVEAEQSLITVEGDKASMEVPAPFAGVVKELKVNVGDKVKTGSLIMIFEVEGAAPAAAPAKQEAAAPAPAAAPAAAPAGGETVAAPMPGTILDIRCTAGQAVKGGDVLFILEAMKMENEICAPHDGTVGTVCVQKGASVQTGAALCTM